jgi:nitroreductase
MNQTAYRSLAKLLTILVVVSIPAASLAQDLKTIDLPKPQITGGMPLMEALSARKSTREFGPEALSPQMMSNLLWAAFGVNRTEIPGRAPKPGRTAPSAMNMQEIDLYVAMPEGVFLYDAVANRLIPVMAKDVRAMTNGRPAAGTAPICLIFVEDQDKRPSPPPAPKPSPAGAPPVAPPAGAPQAAPPRATSGEVDAGFIGQNVYLFCASAGLNAWFYGTDREGLHKALNLRPGQKVLYGQAVGHPKK